MEASTTTPSYAETVTYDGVGRTTKIQKLDAGNVVQTTATYTRGPSGELLGVGTGSGAGSAYAWTDQHTDLVGLFSATGSALTGSTTYDPLGTVLNTSGMVGNLGYQSEWTDELSDRVNMLTRWYNTDTGQFDTRDSADVNPVPDSIAANRFQYGDGNPLTTVDPTGHWGWSKFKSAVKSTVKAATNPVSTFRAAKNTVSSTFKYVSSGRAWSDVKAGAKKFTSKASKAWNTVKKSTVKWAKKKINTVKDAAHSAKKCLSSGVGKCVKQTAKKAVKKAVDSAKSTVEAIKKDPWKFVATAAAALVATVAVGALCATGVGCLIVAGAVAGAMSAGTGYMVDVAQGEEKFSWSNLAGTMIEGGLDGALSGGLGRLGGGGLKYAGAAASRLPSLASRLSGAGKTAGGGAPTRVAGGGAAARSGGGSSGSGPAPEGRRSDAQSGAGCGSVAGQRHSFDPSTRVLMADGSAKPIEDLQLGDEVAATDPVTGERAAKPVTFLHVNQDRDLTDVTVRDGGTGRSTVLKTTQHHPFWDATDRQWVDAGQLKPGHRLLVHDDKRLEGDGSGAGVGGGGPPGRQVTVVAVRNFAGDERMHDLTVADIHTYHVLAGDAPVLVHNCNRDIYDHGGSVRYGKLDSLNRPTGIHASITKSLLDTGQPAKGLSITGFPKGQGTILNLGRGHLLADRLGGKRNKHNLVPLTQDPVNSPIMRDGIEQTIYDAVKGGQAVQYNVIPLYDGDSLIPRALQISAYGSGGLKIDPFEISNPAGMFGVGDEDW